MKAVIMAGGEGTRLRPLTCDRPKPMVPVMNRPVMEHTIELLKQHGIRDIVVTLYYLPEIIEGYFGDGTDFGVKLTYFTEETPLGTAGSVKNAEAHLDEPFLVISGDALTDIDLTALIKFHQENEASATIALTRVDSPLEYGVVISDEGGRIRRFLEKPSWGEVFSDTVNTGIYVFDPKVLGLFKRGEVCDFSKNLFPLLQKRKDPLFGFVAEGYWCDIGNLHQYRQVHYDILEGRAKVKIPGEMLGDDIWVGSGVDIHPDVEMHGPLVIGNNCKIKRGCRIKELTVIGNNNIVHEEASLKRTILWHNSYIGKRAEVRGAVICNGVSIKANSAIFEGSVVGDGSSVGQRSTVNPAVKIWPGKVIQPGTTVTMSLIWGSTWNRTLFGTYGVAGLANVEITPEFASKLGAAYGASLPKGARVCVSCDSVRMSRMIRRALISGILSVGVNVTDLGRCTTPVARYAIRAHDLTGGIHIRLSPFELSNILLEFLDERGLNIDKGTERKIENTFFREDFRRASMGEVGEVNYRSRLIDDYLNEVQGMVDTDRIRRAKCKVVVDYDPDHLSTLLPAFLERMGCEIIRPVLPRASQGTPRSLDDILATVGGLAAQVTFHEAIMGVVIDDNAEKLLMVDERGQVVSDELFLALVSLMVLRSARGGRLPVPINAPRIIEKMAQQYESEVIWTKANPRDLMEKIMEDKILFGGKGLLQMYPVFDALLSLAKILELLATEQVTLSHLVDMVPEFHMIKESAPCPWEQKGRVMRQLVEESREKRVQLLDGVKVFHDEGWALVLPDAEEPSFQIYAEAGSMDLAQELSTQYRNKIAEWQNG